MQYGTIKKLLTVGVVVATGALGGCLNQEYVENCEDSLRAKSTSAGALKIVNSKWTKTGRDVKVFIDYDAPDASGRMARGSANCVFKGDTLVAFQTKNG